MSAPSRRRKRRLEATTRAAVDKLEGLRQAFDGEVSAMESALDQACNSPLDSVSLVVDPAAGTVHRTIHAGGHSPESLALSSLPLGAIDREQATTETGIASDDVLGLVDWVRAQFSGESDGFRVVLQFEPHVLAGLRAGTMTWPDASGGKGLRTWVTGPTGRIVGHPTWSPDDNNAVPSVGELLDLLALITRQSYLARIDARLQRLEAGVNDLNQWNRDQRRARQLASWTTLRMMWKALNAGDTPDRSTLEGILLDTLASTKHIAMQLDAEDCGQATDELANTCLQTLGIRGVAVEMYAYADFGHSMAHSQIDELRRDLENVSRKYCAVLDRRYAVTLAPLREHFASIAAAVEAETAARRAKKSTP